MPYKFERDELLKLLMRAYDEGNCGFLDLSESVAERLIEENEGKLEVSCVCVGPDMMLSSSTIIGGSTQFVGDTFSARNFGRDMIDINTVRIDTGDMPDNLVAVNSNHEGTRWEPYSETDLIRKET